MTTKTFLSDDEYAARFHAATGSTESLAEEKARVEADNEARRNWTPAQKAEAKKKGDAMLDGFHKGFVKAMTAEREKDATAPKVHNVSKGEFMTDVENDDR